jgi:hypothetical protein
MKKLNDSSYRIVNFLFENLEIENLIFDRIKTQMTLLEGDKVEFRFEFVKEGSPEYNTNKIKCIATVKRNLDKNDD